MPVRIPEEQRAAFAQLLKLNDSQWHALTTALKEEPPSLPLDAYNSRVASRLENTIKGSKQLLTALSGMLGLRERLGTTDELFRQLRHAAVDTGKSELRGADEDWSRFERNLKQFFSAQSSIDAVAKAQGVLYEEERVLVDARVITDLRPIFGTEIEGPPSGFVVAHALRITFYEAGDSREIFFALDSDDLREIQAVVSRALKKEAVLSRLCEQWGVTLFNRPGAS